MCLMRTCLSPANRPRTHEQRFLPIIECKCAKRPCTRPTKTVGFSWTPCNVATATNQSGASVSSINYIQQYVGLQHGGGGGGGGGGASIVSEIVVE
jgi:hypothetical protein